MKAYRPSVAVYGGANMDVQARCRGAYKPGDSNPGTASSTPGGVGRNIAENVARLGLPTELVTVFGGDEVAGVLADGCRAVGIEVGRSLILPDEASPRYICILDADGSLVGAVAAMDSLERFTPEELATRYDPGDSADVVVIDSNLPAATIAAAARRWKGKPLILDTVSVAKASKAAPVVGLFSMVKPNLAEARALLGAADVSGGGDIVAKAISAARALLALGVKETFVSLGALGILWMDGGGYGIARPLSMPVVNVSGAGDAAAAALAWASVAKRPAMDKASLAVAAASLCASSLDAVSKAMNSDTLLGLIEGVRNERLS